MIGWIYCFVALLLTVVIHELAHMVVALLCGVKVEAFSIGFGKVLLHKKLWNIDFRLSLIPLGGYCKLDEDPKTGWLTKRYSKKLAIILAGVTANLLLACICYSINYGSIRLGLFIDFKLIQYIFAKDYEGIYILTTIAQANMFLLQLGLINLISAVFNLIPFPCLDGGYIFLFWFEKLLKKNFAPFLSKITKIGFIVLIILQIILMYWIWFV